MVKRIVLKKDRTIVQVVLVCLFFIFCLLVNVFVAFLTKPKSFQSSCTNNWLNFWLIVLFPSIYLISFFCFSFFSLNNQIINIYIISIITSIKIIDFPKKPTVVSLQFNWISLQLHMLRSTSIFVTVSFLRHNVIIRFWNRIANRLRD